MAINQPRVKQRPPLKGSFPLDHEGECKEEIKKFMKCLEQHDSNHGECRHASKAYLQCRMDKNLMTKEEWWKLGYRDNVVDNKQNGC
ncbi:hypothetical protein LOTGIDRAFT_212966 [Lottia gigantea]|uniref:Cytochrome c oxidase assembly protein COX19 n=1 Tax=Lottia gigantea TaxID=225164 RepID=V4ABW1_LOTGI|nr:hypothetical protein LOTGIDRAFT_212966 [Lottia gigantea]ESP01469.1 hypothetical protein LOTGIDRAFT_212966 [Lottia gigantea]